MSEDHWRIPHSEFLVGLGVELPIIQAPMAGVSTPALAAAVSNGRGLGSLGIGASSLSQARQAIQSTRELTLAAFNVNVFCHRPAVRDATVESRWLEMLAPLFSELGAGTPVGLEEIYSSFLTEEGALSLLLETRPAVVSFHFGLPPADHVAALRDVGIRTLATATNLHEARAIEAAGIDGIVAQGIEAGGHRGVFEPADVDEGLSTSVLVRLLVTNTNLPIIAAGGIMDGHGIRAALDLGAAAAQLGTAFILCPESAASGDYREALKSERAGITRLTSYFSGRPARGLVNRFIEACEASGATVPAYPVAYHAAKQLHAAGSASGNYGFAAHWAGQGAPLARELPAGRLMQILVEELYDGI